MKPFLLQTLDIVCHPGMETRYSKINSVSLLLSLHYCFLSPVHLPSKKEHFDAFPVSSGKLETWSELQTVPLCWVFRLISTLENHFL